MKSKTKAPETFDPSKFSSDHLYNVAYSQRCNYAREDRDAARAELIRRGDVKGSN